MTGNIETGNPMKKILFCATLFLVTLITAGAQPELQWNFRNGTQKGKTWSFQSADSKRKGTVTCNDYLSGGGVNGGGALVCGPGKGHRAYFGKLSNSSAAIDITFKLNAPPSRKMTLFSYQENTWGRAYFGIYLMPGSRFGLLFNIDNKQEKKKFSLETAPAALHAGSFHTLRVTVSSGGMARIYLDGKLLKEDNGAMSFSDFTAPPVDAYHPFATLGHSYWGCNIGEPFDGLIAGLKIMDLPAETPVEENTQENDSASRADANLLLKRTDASPVIDGRLNDSCWKSAEWTAPFLVLGAMSQSINGLWETADSKFQKTASSAAMLYSGDTLYAAIRSPYPAGMTLRAEQKTGENIWLDDCVEFFLRPENSDAYYQLLVNANGAWQGMKHFSNGKSEAWTPAGMKIAASRSANAFDIELALPLAALGKTAPAPGSVWTGNFAREGATCGGLSSWAPVGTSFLAPDRFGKFVFGSRKDYFSNLAKPLEAELKALPKPNRTAENALAKFKQDAQAKGESRKNWTELHNRLGMVANMVIQAVNSGKTHFVWQDDIWANFGPDRKIPFGTRELNALNLEIARGARAITAFLVTNLSSRALMTNLSFTADKTSKNLETLVRFRETAFIELHGGAMIPDPLFELPLGSMLRVAPGNTGMVWLDIDTSALKPGNYAGTVRLYPSFSGFEAKEIRLNLRVSPVDVSKVFVRNWTYAVRAPWHIRALKDYGFNCVIPIPHHYYPEYDANGKAVFPRLEEMIQALKDNGVPQKEMFLLFYPEFSLWSPIRLDDGTWCNFMQPKWQAELAKRLRLLRDWLKEKGFGYEQYAFYPTDEPHGDPENPRDKAHFAFAGGKFIKSIDPKFRLFANPYKLDDGRQQRYFELFDILEPFYPQMNRKLIDEYRNSGREIWTYSIFEKSVQAQRYRHLFWENLDAGFQGPATFYDLFAMSGDAFNSYDSAPGSKVIADYGTIYENRRLKKLTPSRRQEAWYQGLVEFKLAKFCREKIEKRRKAGKDVSAEEKELSQIIQEGFSSGGNMDTAGRKLLKLAERLND